MRLNEIDLVYLAFLCTLAIVALLLLKAIKKTVKRLVARHRAAPWYKRYAPKGCCRNCRRCQNFCQIPFRCVAEEYAKEGKNPFENPLGGGE